MTTLTVLTQLAIPVMSVTSMWVIAEKKHKLGLIIGFSASPLWLYSTWGKPELFGIFLTSVIYVLIYLRGIWNHRKEPLT